MPQQLNSPWFGEGRPLVGDTSAAAPDGTAAALEISYNTRLDQIPPEVVGIMVRVTPTGGDVYARRIAGSAADCVAQGQIINEDTSLPFVFTRDQLDFGPLLYIGAAAAGPTVAWVITEVRALYPGGGK